MIEMRAANLALWPNQQSDGVDVQNKHGQQFIVWSTSGAAFVRDHILADAQTQTRAHWTDLQTKLNRPGDLDDPFRRVVPRLSAAQILDFSNTSALIRGAFIAVGMYGEDASREQVRDFHITGPDFARFLTSYAPRGATPVAIKPRTGVYSVDAFELKR